MRCCSRGPLGRLLGVKTSAEMDQPVVTTFMKSLLAPKARHSHESTPQDGFAVANLGQRPRIMKIKKNISAESAIHFRHTSWISVN